MTRSLIAATLLAGAAAIAQPALARDLVSNDEHAVVETNPASYTGNVVGGGALTVQALGGNANRTVYLQDNFSQRQTPGTVAVTVGNQQDERLIYVPAGSAEPQG